VSDVIRFAKTVPHPARRCGLDGLNCMSVPLCLVGVGLGLVGLIAHRDCNHLFTWIGLLGNGVVILGVVGLYVFNAMLSG
jgi:hypothetical protein